MMRILCLAALVLLVQDVRAYEVETHQQMSERAFYRSRLAEDWKMPESWGLRPEQAQELRFGDRTAVGWIQLGSIDEDSLNGVRFVNHFFNPLDGSGLVTPRRRGIASPEWALSDNRNTDNYAFARKRFLDALTSRTEASRTQSFGALFKSLGHVVHHVQDMAQPQHTRNDVHCPWLLCIWEGVAPEERLRPALYEQYTKSKSDKGGLDQYYLAYPAVYPDVPGSPLTTPRKFWNTESAGLAGVSRGKGMAEFSNRNFVTARTNFGGRPLRLTTTPGFDLPNADNIVIDYLIPVCDAAPSVRDTHPQLCEKYRVTLLSSTIVDTLVPEQDGLVSKISSFGFLDADLAEAGETMIFTQNRIVFDDMQRFLTSRAVAYSTGLLNYFFRGNIAMERDPDSPATYLIRNNGDEELKGKFRLYYDDKDGNRILVPTDWPDQTIPARSAKAGFTFTQPADPPPAAEWTDRFLLVFSGTMGDEAPEGVSPGAITSTIVKDTPFVLFSGFRDDADQPNNSFMEFHFVIPDRYLQTFQNQLSTVRLRLDGVEIPFKSTSAGNCSGIYCDTAFGQHIIGPGTGYSQEWMVTTTRENSFIVRDQYGTIIASGKGLDTINSLSDSTLCRSFTTNEFYVLTYEPGVPHEIELQIDGKLAFGFKVETNPQNQAILSNLKNARINAKRCGIEPKPAQ